MYIYWILGTKGSSAAFLCLLPFSLRDLSIIVRKKKQDKSSEHLYFKVCLMCNFSYSFFLIFIYDDRCWKLILFCSHFENFFLMTLWCSSRLNFTKFCKIFSLITSEKLCSNWYDINSYGKYYISMTMFVLCSSIWSYFVFSLCVFCF